MSAQVEDTADKDLPTAEAQKAKKPRARTTPAPTLLGRTLPQVNLLPESVRAVRRLREMRGWFGLAVLVSLILVVAAWFLGTLTVSAAQDDLAAEQQRTSSLLTEKAQYAEVTPVLTDLSRVGKAVVLASGTEILWGDYVDAVAAVLPSNVSLLTLTTAVGGSGTADPLLGQGYATLTFTGSAGTVPDVASLIDALDSVPGFDGATVSVVQRNDSAVYDVTGTVQVTTAAFSLRLMGEGS